MAVIKSNAYGHGVRELLPVVSQEADWLAVNSLREARQVLAEKLALPLLIMGPLTFEEQNEVQALCALGANIHIVVSRLAEVKHCSGHGIPFHLKVDTGMGRLGSHNSDLAEIFIFLKKNKPSAWRGLMTHFANVEDVLNQDYARLQLARFEEALEDARAINGHVIAHAAASASALLLPESRFDLARIGISMYGFWPSVETKLSALSLGLQPELKPVLAWKTEVAHVNRIATGGYIGYGCSYRAVTETILAVLPVGYNEGYARSLSNQAYVLIRGQRAQLRGRVCMNMIMVDVTHIPGASIGDEAVLIGKQGEEEITADELASLSATINYEVVTRIHPDLKRCLVD